MNEYCILDNLINDLTSECSMLSQELQEMYGNSNVQTNNSLNDNIVFNPYPTPPIETSMDIDEELLSFNNKLPGLDESLITMTPDSATFDPISVSNGAFENVNVDIGSRVINEEELALFMENLVENISNNNIYNGIDQSLLTLQENFANSTIPLDTSIETIIEEIKNNNVSLLESTYSNHDEKLLSDQWKELFPAGNNLLSKNQVDTCFPQPMENIVSKNEPSTILHNGAPS